MAGCCPTIIVDANRHLTPTIIYGLQDMDGRTYGIFDTEEAVLTKKQELKDKGIPANVYQEYVYTED